jgi:ubiquinone/menaquinone biosynthesis C-methylase UbiE
MQRFSRWQRLAVERLELGPAQTVIDVACGTGLNFPLVEERIGPEGKIIGIDLSPEMLGVASRRVESAGWRNVELIEASVDQAHLRELANAALFSFTHDVLQSPEAVANVVRHLRPEARVSSVGAKNAARWNFPVNFAVRRAARPYVTTFEGLERPWHELERYTDGMKHHSLALGGAYVAWGQVARE